MKFYHPKVVDTSVLFRRKNGSKMKLKNLADKILNVNFFTNIKEKNSIFYSWLKRRLSCYLTSRTGQGWKLRAYELPKIVPFAQRSC